MKLAAALLLFLALAGCGGGALSLLTGGGSNVAANVQAGVENTQGLRTSSDHHGLIEVLG